MNSLGHDVVQRDVDLAPLTTYKLGGAARWFADVTSEAMLRDVLDAHGGDDVLILGRGSNVVVADTGFAGLVVRLVGEFLVASLTSDGTIRAGGGMPLPKLARFAVGKDRGGLEFYVGIPGSVGGAVRMNAGGHGSDTAARLIDVTVLDVATRATTTRLQPDLDLSYRHSNLAGGDVVLDARFNTTEQPRAEGEALLRDITRWRKEHQPGGTLNAGSVFKNPAGDSAGRIIDAQGLKGYRRGGVAVSELHANFFVSDREASAQDVWDLVWDVRRQVGEQTGVWLTPELRFVGAFSRSGDEEAGP